MDVCLEPHVPCRNKWLKYGCMDVNIMEVCAAPWWGGCVGWMQRKPAGRLNRKEKSGVCRIQGLITKTTCYHHNVHISPEGEYSRVEIHEWKCSEVLHQVFFLFFSFGKTVRCAALWCSLSIEEGKWQQQIVLELLCNDDVRSVGAGITADCWKIQFRFKGRLTDVPTHGW